MENNAYPKTNDCDMSGLRPALMGLPYPPVKVEEPNGSYADLLSVDYCGAVSEMSAIAQYINNENRMSCEKCPLAKTVLSIAMAEMIHLQKLGELIDLLGGEVDFTVRQRGGRPKMWTPAYLTIPRDVRKMILADIDAEKAAIDQYRYHINRIQDASVNAVLLRIIKDEEYHIMMLQTLL